MKYLQPAPTVSYFVKLAASLILVATIFYGDSAEAQSTGANEPKGQTVTQAVIDAHEMIASVETSPHKTNGSGAKAPHAEGSFASGSRDQVTWTVPQGWVEVAPTSMRLGNFLYTDGSNGQKVEISVVSLPGSAGGVAANIDMWRSQIGLPRVEGDQALKQIEELTLGELKISMADLVSTENIIESKYKARIMGAISVHGTNTWFFKMKGEDSAVGNSKENFLSFLRSVKFK